jgi:hypothetical protein
MNYIRKIPLLLGTGAGLIIGLIGLSTGVPNDENILNMCIGMAIFYVVGILVRTTVHGIAEQMAAMKLKEEEEERLKKEQSRKEEQKRAASQAGASIDFRIGDEEPESNNDFEDLPIAEFIRKK